MNPFISRQRSVYLGKAAPGIPRLLPHGICLLFHCPDHVDCFKVAVIRVTENSASMLHRIQTCTSGECGEDPPVDPTV